MKGEMDEIELVVAPALGQAALLAEAAEDAHVGHAVVYVPDLSSMTGWAAHQVPERRDRGEESRAIGFARQRR